MNKRQLSAIETKKKLIEAGLKICKEKGFDSISVEDITKEAKVSKGSFYTYFEKKEDIIIEICREPFRKIIEDTKNSNKNIVDKLIFYFHTFMDRVEMYGIHICREWIKDVIDPNFSQKDWDNKKWDYDVKMLTEILNDSIKNKELSKDFPVELFVHIIISQLYGMMLCWCMSDKKFEPLNWTKKFCEIQLKSMFKPYLLIKE